ncbi:hypothetical protein ACFSRY_06440 [Pontibacter locisalis]|uniref:MORN repeat-containing protein n=1 Tax=Pontibacter locisalis TaxID=1719035 RepID=A0ABW5IKR9_9BACT
MEKELTQVKRQLSWLKYYAVISSTFFMAFMMLSMSSKKSDVIRAKGIIIEDSLGRDRILIGATIPPSKDRVRTNPEKVRETWAKSMGGEKYMKNYATYEHGENGIIFLNEQGYDKLVLAENVGDPNTGKRLVKAAGFSFNDDEGYERGGLGISKTQEEKYRVVFGMDDPNVGEALHLFLLEDGTKGMQIAYEGGRMLLGRAEANSGVFGNKDEFAGIKIENKDGKVLWEKNAYQQTVK